MRSFAFSVVCPAFGAAFGRRPMKNPPLPLFDLPKLPVSQKKPGKHHRNSTRVKTQRDLPLGPRLLGLRVSVAAFDVFIAVCNVGAALLLLLLLLLLIVFLLVRCFCCCLVPLGALLLLILLVFFSLRCFSYFVCCCVLLLLRLLFGSSTVEPHPWPLLTF